MDSNEQIINLVLSKIPGNDIFLDKSIDSLQMYWFKVNYDDDYPVGIPKSMFNMVRFDDIDFDVKLNRLVDVCINGFKKLLRLHSDMCHVVPYDDIFKGVTDRRIITGRDIDPNKPVYVVMFESEYVDAILNEETTIPMATLQMEFIQEDEMNQYYPTRRSDNYITIKKRI